MIIAAIILAVAAVGLAGTLALPVFLAWLTSEDDDLDDEFARNVFDREA